MENETFRSRVANLVARSRKALRLYSNAGRGGSYGDTQTAQWRDITSDLLRDLTSAVQKNQSVKNLSAAIFSIRDKFNSIWRAAESEMHVKHKELLNSLEQSDYVKSALLSGGLVSLKARFQASQAAHHELEELIKSSHYAHDPIELTDPMEIEITESESDEQKSVANSRSNSFSLKSKAAKVIPIRKVL
jgi:hypothetical protein